MTVGEFISREHWKFAKTYAKFAPHEYIVRGRCVATDEEFDKFGNFILSHGMRMFYYSHERKYLFVDGWFYWILRDEENPANAVINRCRPDDYDIVFMQRGTQARKAAKEKEKEQYQQLKLPIDGV